MRKSNIKDETGNTYGLLKVIRRATQKDKQIEDINKIAYWVCECQCEEKNITVVSGADLRRGNTLSCGCLRGKNEAGKTYGILKVIRRATKEEIVKEIVAPIPGVYWLCECKCGNKKITNGMYLRTGAVKSCGCAQVIGNKERKLDIERTKEQIILLENKHELEEFLINFEKLHGRKITAPELTKVLGYKQSSHAWNCIRRRGLDKYVQELPRGNSHFEIEIIEELELDSSKYIKNDRLCLNSNEIDIYIKDKNIGIEFNGNYWHSEIYKNMEYHKNKTKAALLKGIELIHVFEHEYMNSKKHKILIDILKYKLYDSKFINVCTCRIEAVSEKIAMSFNTEYNLYGHKNAELYFGVYYNDILVELISANIKEVIKIVQYTRNYRIKVIGGLKYLVNRLIKIKDTAIVVNVDASKFDGSSFKRVGFKQVDWSIPNYIIWNTYTHEVIEQCKESDGLGEVRIYDCGTYTLVLM